MEAPHLANTTGCVGGLDQGGACMQCLIRCHERHGVWSRESFAACARCASDCYSASTLPFFFKYVSFCMQSTYYRPSMEIPFSFARMHIPDAVCHVELEAPDRKLWLVKMRHVENEYTLRQGWKEFAVSHQLARGDALLFQLMSKAGSEKCHFAVKLFKQKPSLTSNPYVNLEIKLSLESQPKQNKHSEMNGNREWGCRKKARHAERKEFGATAKGKRYNNGTEHIEVKPNYNLTKCKRNLNGNLEWGCRKKARHAERKQFGATAKGKRYNNGTEHIEAKPNYDLTKCKRNLIDREDTRVEPHADMQEKLCKDFASKKQENAARLHERVIGSGLLFSGITYARKKAVVQTMANTGTCMNDKKCPLKNHDGLKLQKCLLEEQSENVQSKSSLPSSKSSPKYPRFCKTMLATNVGPPFSMNIPRSFSACHMDPRMIETCYDMKLVLGQNMEKRKTRECRSDGAHWIVCVRRSLRNGKGTLIFCKGWKEFASRNKLKVGDMCMFELVEPFTLMVHIFADVKPTQNKMPVQPCQLPIRTRLLSSLQPASRIAPDVVKSETANPKLESH